MTSKKQTIYAAVALDTNKAPSVSSSIQNNRYHRVKDARSISNNGSRMSDASHKHHMMITNKLVVPSLQLHTVKPRQPSPKNSNLLADKSGPPSTTSSLEL